MINTHTRSSGNHALPLGSDFPVEGINPLLGFYAAVSRMSIHGDSPSGKGNAWYIYIFLFYILPSLAHGDKRHWHALRARFPEQRLTRTEALKGMTKDPAYASFNEEHLGSLESGKLADFVVLDTDIMTVPELDILSTKVIATVVDGRPMYGKL